MTSIPLTITIISSHATICDVQRLLTAFYFDFFGLVWSGPQITIFPKRTEEEMNVLRSAFGVPKYYDDDLFSLLAVPLRKQCFDEFHRSVVSKRLVTSIVC